MILRTIVVGELSVNYYLVGDEATRQAMVIDPGDQADLLLREVERLDLTVQLIVNTHGHFDHVLANGPLKAATGAPVAIHEADQPLLGYAPQTALLWLGRQVPPVPSPDILLKDGDLLSVGQLTFAVLHTPGHSPGGICLHADEVVFTGDILFHLGVGRTDLPGGDHHRMMRSLAEKLLVLPDDTVVYPGHGPETTIGLERRRNPFITSLQAD